MKHIRYPSIEQFRNVIKHVKQNATFKGLDENNQPIYDRYATLPKIKYIGTIKQHGTNSAVVKTRNGEMYPETRERIISIESDNAGFACFQVKNKDIFTEIFIKLFSLYTDETIAIFGEFAGSSIQKGVALSQLNFKFFSIFGIKLVESDKWLTREEICDIISTKYNDNLIYHVYQFKTFEIEIDFEHPEIAQNQIVEWVSEVENECPVGKYFGISGTGEGIVFKPVSNEYGPEYVMKCKGTKHSVSKVKTIAAVDIERLNSINELVDTFVTENRLQQGIQVMKENGHELTEKNTGIFIKWVVSDICKEEKDVIAESGFVVKDITGPINKKAKDFWFTYLNENM